MNQVNVSCHLVKKKKITNRKQYELEKAKYNVVTKTFKQTLAIKREVR